MPMILEKILWSSLVTILFLVLLMFILFQTYVSPAFLAELKRDFETRAYVSEVFYDIPLLEILDNNIKK